jgi:hypothetical protein
MLLRTLLHQWAVMSHITKWAALPWTGLFLGTILKKLLSLWLCILELIG